MFDHPLTRAACTPLDFAFLCPLLYATQPWPQLTKMKSLTELRQAYDAAGQSQVFHFISKLDAAQQESLLKQLSAIDIDRVNRVYTRAIEAEKAFNDPQADAQAIEPLPSESFDSTLSASPSKVAEWRKIGLDAISKGQVGVLLMAGGQGTRLGSSAPKGCYDIGLPSHKSLFQYQAERIKRLQVIAAEHGGQSSVTVPWYIMTSGPTRPETVSFFESNNYFGLDRTNVIFFEQGQFDYESYHSPLLIMTAVQELFLA